MASLKELNIRLASLANTRKITQAMKLIATTKLNKFQFRIRQAVNYHQELNIIFDKVLAYKKVYPELLTDNLLWKNSNDSKRVRILLFTSDRGLCGSFNSNVIKACNEFIKEIKTGGNKEIIIDTYGKKGFDFFSRRKYTIGMKHEQSFSEQYQTEVAHEFAKKYIDDFLNCKIDELYVIYNSYISAISQKPTIRKVLPFDLQAVEELDDKKSLHLKQEKQKNNRGEESKIFSGLFEPNFPVFTSELVKKFIEFEFYFSFLNSTTGEHAARMTSMDSATKNSTDMIDNLTLERNRVRQAAITKELIEIISGAESL